MANVQIAAAGPSLSSPTLTPSPSRSLTPSPAPALTPSPSPTLTPAPSSSSERELARITGKVKGTLLIARMKFVRSRGEAEAERVLKRLSAEDQATLRGMLLPSSWYPAGALMRLEMTAVAILSKGDRRELFLEMGRFTASTNLSLTGMHRPYVRENDPHFILENVPRLYSSQHSTGHRTHERTGPTSAIVRHFDTDPADADDCLTVAGWLERAVEISGGRAATVEERCCRGRGAPHCEFLVSWK